MSLNFIENKYIVFFTMLFGWLTFFIINLPKMIDKIVGLLDWVSSDVLKIAILSLLPAALLGGLVYWIRVSIKSIIEEQKCQDARMWYRFMLAFWTNPKGQNHVIGYDWNKKEMNKLLAEYKDKLEGMGVDVSAIESSIKNN